MPSEKDYSSNPQSDVQKFYDRAFQIECNYFNEPIVLYSRNNGIMNDFKKNSTQKKPLSKIFVFPSFLEIIETSNSIEESQNDLDFTLQTNNEKSTLQKNNNVEIFDQIDTLKAPENLIDKPNTSETFENQPFLLRQPLENNSIGTLKGSESSNTSRNIMMDPNEISFNKDQFNFLFNKDLVAEKERLQLKHKNDILVVDHKIEEENLPEMSHVKRELYTSDIHDTEGSQNNLSTKESTGHNQLEKKFYLSEKMLHQNSNLIYKLQEENMILKDELNFLKGENELIKENIVRHTKIFKI